MGLQQMLIACGGERLPRVSGVRIHSGNIRGIFQAAFGRQRGSFRSVWADDADAAGILSNVANRGDPAGLHGGGPDVA